LRLHFSAKAALGMAANKRALNQGKQYLCALQSKNALQGA
jgi:hypothetical protein